ncbi:MAG: hypothetical protein EOO39_02835 [Cytophagaceae bacterium]|nr:MAG: hypothetical protein EOO39_02835 [Cytophagaceae bacterium]
MKNRTLFFVSVAIAVYLLSLYLNGYVLKLDYVLIGVLQELLTIPVLVLLVVLFIFTIIRITRSGTLKGPYLYGAFSLLSVSLVSIVSSFFL